jgi:branched-chain amino acid transport system permease protein
MVMVGRERIHRWVLWLPNLVIRKVTGRRAAIVVPEGDAT